MFKENCPDIRNTKVVDIYRALSEYTSQITVLDPWANAEEVKHEYNLDIVTSVDSIAGCRYDAVVHAVSHQQFLSMDLSALRADTSVLFDVKSVLPRDLVNGRL